MTKPNDVHAPSYFAHKTVNTTPDRFSLSAGDLVFSGTYAGSAYVDTTYNVAGFGLDDGQNNVAMGAVPLPPNWGGKYYRVAWAWVPAGTAAGTARFGIGTTRIKSGTVYTALEALTVYDASSGSTVTPVVTSQDFTTALPTAIAEGEFIGLAVRRRADLSDDTLSHDIYLLSIEISLR